MSFLKFLLNLMLRNVRNELLMKQIFLGWLILRWILGESILIGKRKQDLFRYFKQLVRVSLFILQLRFLRVFFILFRFRYFELRVSLRNVLSFFGFFNEYCLMMLRVIMVLKQLVIMSFFIFGLFVRIIFGKLLQVMYFLRRFRSLGFFELNFIFDGILNFLNFKNFWKFNGNIQKVSVLFLREVGIFLLESFEEELFRNSFVFLEL